MKCNAVTRIGALILAAMALLLKSYANLDQETTTAVVGGAFTLLAALRSSTNMEQK